jgi:hypothetical protein
MSQEAFDSIQTPAMGFQGIEIILHPMSDFPNILRPEPMTRMDAELVQRSEAIRQRLKQLGDSL